MRWLLGFILFLIALTFDESVKINLMLAVLVIAMVLYWQQHGQLDQLRALVDKLQQRLKLIEAQLQQDRAAKTESSTAMETNVHDEAAVDDKSETVAARAPVFVPPSASVSKSDVTPRVDEPILPATRNTEPELETELPALPTKPLIKPAAHAATTTATKQVPQPSLFEQLWDLAYGWLTGGNTVVRVGIVILFFGLAFLLKYSAEHELIPLPLRYLAVGSGAILLLVLGWRWRHTRSAYALALQGGAVASLYLLCFAALRLHQLLPPAMALFALIAIGSAAAMLAILQNAMSLALIGQAGGFLAPILASSGGGSHVHLFSYYVLLNAVILSIAVYKKWRPLNLTGFVFTFGIGTLWGGMRYEPELYASTQPFLLIFFVMYVVIAILFARKNDENWRPFVPSRIDGSLVFGVPLVGFGLQYALVRDWEFGPAFSALALAIFYVAAAFAIKRKAALALMTESFIALAVVFGSLAIPLALDAQWSSGSWAIEAAAIIWVSLRQQQLWPRVFAYVLLLGACVLALSAHLQHAFVATRYPALIFTDILMSAGLLASWQFLHRYNDRLRSQEATIKTILLALIALWWSWAAINTIDWYVAAQWQVAATAFVVSLTMTLMMLLQKGIDYRALFAHPVARLWAWLMLFAATVMAVSRWQYIYYDEPFNGIILFNGIVVAAHLLYAAWFAHHQREHVLNRLLTHIPIWIAFALLWRSCWLALAPTAIVFTSATQLFIVLLLIALFFLIARRLKWSAPAYASVVLLPAATIILMNGSHRELVHPLAQRAWLIWPLLFAWQIWQLKTDAFLSRAIHNIQHWWQSLLLILVISWSGSWWLAQHTSVDSAWTWLARLGIPAASLLLMTLRNWRQRWPLTSWREVYDLGVGGMLIFIIVLQFLYSTVSNDGNATPLPYLPVLNPLDLAHIISLLAIVLFIRGSSMQDYLHTQQLLRGVFTAIALLIFIWLTSVLLRAVHHFADVPYQFDELWHATIAQVALSLFWSALALTLMMVATRQAVRWLWWCGAALMAVVVIKLFAVDLSQVSGLQRVLSFLGVGVLMLVIGYLSPVPPKSSAQGAP